MKFFSFFKKNTPSEKKEGVLSQAETAIGRTATLAIDQREIARTTKLKIDAIESEMALDILNTPRTKKSSQASPTSLPLENTQSTGLSEIDFPRYTKAVTITQLSDSTVLIQEVAILFANNQNTSIETILLSAIQEDQLGELTDSTWHMLLDFYQATGNREKFEGLSLDYAQKFEASPAAWLEIGDSLEKNSIQDQKTNILFVGALDEKITIQLEQLKKIDAQNSPIRLDFSRINSVTQNGCALLLKEIDHLKKLQYELIFVGGEKLADTIQNTIQVGRRDETEHAWLLLLEILRILGRKQEFEDLGIDFCITFEISPPSFDVPPTETLTTKTEKTNGLGLYSANTHLSEDFFLPQIIEGDLRSLLEAINQYATQHSVLIFNCLQLTRVSFNSAAQLLNHLTTLSSEGKIIEFHQITHLVSALFKVVGLERIAKIIPRK